MLGLEGARGSWRGDFPQTPPELFDTLLNDGGLLLLTCSQSLDVPLNDVDFVGQL